MSLKFSTKPKRITRGKALELARQAKKYYKHDNSGFPFSVYLEEKMDNPSSYRVVVGREVDPTEHYDKGIARYKLSKLPTSEEYNGSNNKPTQKQLEDYIYVNGNHKLQEHTKDALHQEFRNNYLDRWANNGGTLEEVKVIIYFKNNQGDTDVIYKDSLSDDMFVVLDQWLTVFEEEEELEGAVFDWVGEEGVTQEIADGTREFRVGQVRGVGDVNIKVGVNKYGEFINLENYMFQS